ncbi:MAG: AEC family transporter [Clostridia bacterium]|nr:AEC family transporter [Clostridia bacterium]
MADILLKSCSFVFIIVLGYILKRAGLFKERDYKIVVNTVIYITLPAAVVTSFASYELDLSLLLAVLIGFALNVSIFLISLALCRKKEYGARVLWQNLVPGYSIGTFAMPFAQSFFSPIAVVATCLFDAGNAIMCCGGTYAITDSMLNKSRGGKLKLIGKRLLSSAPFVSYVVMFCVCIAGIKVPVGVLDFISPIAGANAFLAMFMIGMMFEVKIEKSMLKEVVCITTVRLIVALIAVVLLYLFLPFSDEIKQALIICTFAPVSTTSTVLAEKMKADPAVCACIYSLSIPISIVCIVASLLFFGVL